MEVQLLLFPVDCCLFPPPCAIHNVSMALMSLAGDLTLSLSITVGRSQWL